jgi:HK97 family phage major capsid protein
MASAAYWIGSQCDEVVATPSAAVGSIGVFMVHLDESAFDERIGLQYSLIFAGKHKVDGNPYEPLSDDARAALQEQVDEYYTLFVNDVARGRKVNASKVRAGYGEGRCLTATQAMDAGLVDRIDTFDGVLSSLGAKNVSASGRPRNPPGVASASAARADVPTDPAETPSEIDDDNEDEVCPDCGAPVNEDGSCSACDYHAEDDSGDDTNATTSLTNSAATDRAAALPDESPEPTPAPEAREQTMPQETAAPPTNGAGHADAIRAERQRASEIRAMGASLITAGVQQATIDHAVDEGLSVNEAAAAFNADVRARHAANPRIGVGADREAERPFASFGEQVMCAIRAARGQGVDRRLQAVNARAQEVQRRFEAGTPSGMNESVGSEGGFFIQPELLPGIIDPVYIEDPILSRVTRIPIGAMSSGVKYNVVDETARTTGNRWGGIQMYWAAEADQATPSKPKMRQMQLDLKKLIGLCYLTDELQIDAPAAEALISRAFQAELKFMLGAAIFAGTGGGQPLGILKSNAVVSQAIEGTQTIANTQQFISQNVTKMLARVPASLWNDVIWLYNQELLPYLVNATVGSSTTVPVFMAIGGLANRPNDTILGRDAFPSELSEAVGTPGDIMAVVPSQYHLADKGGPLQALSLHVRFLFDEQVLRITYRTDGAPVWKQSVTPYKGANTRSPFVSLQVRS